MRTVLTTVGTPAWHHNQQATIACHRYTRAVHWDHTAPESQAWASQMDSLFPRPWCSWLHQPALSISNQVLGHDVDHRHPPAQQVLRRASPSHEAQPLSGAQPSSRSLTASALPMPWVAGASKASPSSATNAECKGSYGLTRKSKSSGAILFSAKCCLVQTAARQAVQKKHATASHQASLYQPLSFTLEGKRVGVFRKLGPGAAGTRARPFIFSLRRCRCPWRSLRR